MAKIDTRKIEGFADMTAEQKLEALMKYDIPEPDYSGYVKKDVYDKTASDLAEWKKKHNALLSDEEKARQEKDEELTALRQKVEDMERERTMATHKAQYIALGYDEALAEDTAKALCEGDATKVFMNQKQFLESHDKAYKAQLMGLTPTPPAGQNAPGKVDYNSLIADARARGDVAEEAHYIRLSQQQENTNH